MILIRNVTKTYGRRTALSAVSLRIEDGSVTLVLGANGAGKSTLLRCLLGITDFDGSISVDGLDPLTSGKAVRARVGYMPQSGGLHPDLTVRETMRLFAAIRRVPDSRGPALLAEAGLDDHADSTVGELSGGMRQRLGFALALLTNPRVLILDEPSSSLDAASREWLARRLREVAAQGCTVIVSTHAGPELLAAGDRRVMLEDGRILSDDGGELKGAANGSPPAAVTPGGTVMPLVRREIQDAIRNRWLIGYASVLGLLGFAAALSGIDSSAGLALQAFGRTTATLMNLCLLLSPLVAVLMGGAAIAGERERGTLEHLLAQPLGRTQVLLGKHAGTLLALTAATAIGFVPAGVLIGWTAGPEMLGYYLLFPLLASIVGAAMAALGMLISVTSRTGVQAQGAGIVAWFVFVLLYDLVMMGSLAFSGMPVGLLAAGLIVNPVDAGRVLGVLALEPDLYLLGPAGAYLTSRLARFGTALLLLGSLTFWAIAPLGAAIVRFRLPAPVRNRQNARTTESTNAAPAATEEVTV